MVNDVRDQAAAFTTFDVAGCAYTQEVEEE